MTTYNLSIDEYGQVFNDFESAMVVRDSLLKGQAIALPLDLGNMTMFHISFVPLDHAIPMGAIINSQFQQIIYSDGSNKGVQINIDRHSSYALPYGSVMNEFSYLMEKWGLTLADAQALLPFFNTVLTGKNYFTTNVVDSVKSSQI